jgi:hypothetical protein
MPMKICPLCNQQIKKDDSIVAILGGFVRQTDEQVTSGGYTIEATRQAILSHVSCPPAVPAQV